MFASLICSHTFDGCKLWNTTAALDWTGGRSFHARSLLLVRSSGIGIYFVHASRIRQRTLISLYPHHQKLLWTDFSLHLASCWIHGGNKVFHIWHILKTAFNSYPMLSWSNTGLNCEYHDFPRHHTVGLLSTPPVDSQGKSGGNARNRRTRFVGGTQQPPGELAQLGEVLAIGHN